MRGYLTMAKNRHKIKQTIHQQKQQVVQKNKSIIKHIYDNKAEYIMSIIALLAADASFSLNEIEDAVD
jgi:hypothetical protein